MHNFDESIPGFPTYGEFLNYIFRKTGLLATGARFTETSEVKSFQKALNRLSDEIGKIEDNFHKAFDELIECLAVEGLSKKYSAGLQGIFWDAIQQYGDLIRNEGTYFNKSDGIKWLLKIRLINRICKGMHKYRYMLNIHINPDDFPGNPFWYLPETEAGRITSWPTNVAFEWTYQQLGVIETRFHYPTSVAGENEYPYAQNLENARRWARGERCRSWHEMKRNLMQSFAAMEACSLPEHRRHVSRKQKYIMGRVWFVARFTTEVCKDIEKQYGEEFLVECIEYFKQETMGHKLDGMKIEREVAKLRSIIRPTTTKQVNAAWRIVTKKHWEAEAGRQAGEMTDSVKKYMTTYTKKYGNRALLLPQHIKELRELYGPPINFWINAYNFRGVPEPTRSYFQCLSDVIKLVKQDGITLAQVEQYGQRLIDEGQSATLQWTYHWLNSRYHYQAGRYKEAFDAMTIAFKKAKYVAGNQQQSLIHQYIHLSAMVDNWVEFKKGVAWALYMGLKLRWIGDKHLNEKELKEAFCIYKINILHETFAR